MHKLSLLAMQTANVNEGEILRGVLHGISQVVYWECVPRPHLLELIPMWCRASLKIP